MVTAEQTALERAAHAAAQALQRPPLSRLWRALEDVPDPEVPAVSVVELGIVRAIGWDAGDPTLLVVELTPTYSGCPATDVITAAVRDALSAAGVPAVRIDVVLAPPWTTDWITPTAQRKLREYGIAPPGAGLAASAATAATTVNVTGISPLRRAGVMVPCPRCGSTHTELVSQFGSTACKALYRCSECLEPFDYFKPY